HVPSATVAASIVRTRLHADVLFAWLLFGVRHAMEYYRRDRMREVAESRLQAQLARAQVDVLRAQLQPHFLFNTLHAISALMYRDVESADRMMTRLSDFLRLTLDSSGVQEVTLKREMEYLDKYIEIEQVRFGERLRIERRIEPRALDLLVPNLALQPLVENAVRYAIAPRAAGGRIEIVAKVVGDELWIEVKDDGAGATGGVKEGVGLSNTRARLEQLYGKWARLELGNAESGGFRARLRMAAHTEPVHASSDS
ncbi:MAG TPA: histidine kinase, partial [Bryobacteraceae bacterium]|nr:histidine kinase [Bryobacteraceae bacterium]